MWRVMINYIMKGHGFFKPIRILLINKYDIIVPCLKFFYAYFPDNAADLYAKIDKSKNTKPQDMNGKLK